MCEPVLFWLGSESWRGQMAMLSCHPPITPVVRPQEGFGRRPSVQGQFCLLPPPEQGTFSKTLGWLASLLGN